MRVLWFASGTAAGVYLTAKARRAAESLTVEGVHDRLTGWFAGARVLRDELRTGMAEKEAELRDQLLANPATALGHGRPEPAAIGAASAPDAAHAARRADHRPPGDRPDRHAGLPDPGHRDDKDDS